MRAPEQRQAGYRENDPQANARSSALVIVNTEANESFTFRFFPVEIERSRRANWRQQEVATGTQPIVYANREGRRMTFPSLWLDKSVEGESLTPEINRLFALQDAGAKGRPPVLLVLWGDQQERVVLEEITVTERGAYPDGTPFRAEIALTLIEAQDEDDTPTRPVRRNEQATIYH